MSVNMTEVIVALLSLIGTLGGSMGGILVSTKLTNYRIQQLEQKVDKQGQKIEAVSIHEIKIEQLERRLDKLVAKIGETD